MYVPMLPKAVFHFVPGMKIASEQNLWDVLNNGKVPKEKTLPLDHTLLLAN